VNRAILAFFAAAMFAGCAVEGSPFRKSPVVPDHAVIYVYRPYSYASVLLRPPVTCGDDTARIGPGGYYAFVVPTGKTICTIQQETSDQLEIDAEPRSYYVREEIGWGTLSGHPHLDPVDADRAQSEISKCCVREPDSAIR
jgi:hypothetical protein